MAYPNCMYFICTCQGSKFEGILVVKGLLRRPPAMAAVIASFLFRRQKQRKPQEHPGKKTVPLFQEIFRVVAPAFRTDCGIRFAGLRGLCFSCEDFLRLGS